MSAAAVILLFSVSCRPPCAATTDALLRLEREAHQILRSRGHEVQSLRRPKVSQGARALAAWDQAAHYGADRMVDLDLQSSGRTLWVTHFVRGVVGAFRVDRVSCSMRGKGAVVCGELPEILLRGFRPRRAEEVDVVSALRWSARDVEVCVRAEDETPAFDRVYGRVALDLEASPEGVVHVKAVAPARVARSRFGACLRKVFSSLRLGPFEGESLRFRVPIDL